MPNIWDLILEPSAEVDVVLVDEEVGVVSENEMEQPASERGGTFREYRRGASTRKRYTNEFKARIIEQYKAALEAQELYKSFYGR